MQTISRAVVPTILALLVAAALGAGCGGQQDARDERPPAVATTWFTRFDCSRSFHPFAAGYLDEFAALAQEAARSEVVLRYGCVAGSALEDGPPRTDDYSDAGPIAMAVRNADSRARLAQARALGSRGKMAEKLGARSTRGSDPLGAIERATHDARLERIVLWTDFQVIDGGDDLRGATPADVERIARRWQAKLGRSLEGVTVTVVGIGRGSGDDEAVRVARKLAHTVVTGAGGRLLAGDSLASATEVEG